MPPATAATAKILTNPVILNCCLVLVTHIKNWHNAGETTPFYLPVFSSALDNSMAIPVPFYLPEDLVLQSVNGRAKHLILSTRALHT